MRICSGPSPAPSSSALADPTEPFEPHTKATPPATARAHRCTSSASRGPCETNPLMFGILRLLKARLANVMIAVGDVYTQVWCAEDVRELIRATKQSARAEPGCLYPACAESLGPGPDD